MPLEIFFLVLIGFFVWKYFNSQKKAKIEKARKLGELHEKLAEAKEEQTALLAEYLRRYRTALERVKAEPTVPKHHEEALQLGRAYAAATASAYKQPLLTEAQIGNDLAAATAGAVKHVQAASVDERLRLLGELLASGRITQLEHDTRRASILASI